MHFKKGFTLVELLLVISLVSILSGLCLAIINPRSFFARARDSKRLANMALLMETVERYNIDNGSYPDAMDVMRVSSSLPPGQIGPLVDAENGWIAGGLSKYTSVIPIDPVNSDFLVYRYKRLEGSYELDCYMEYYKENAQSDGGNNETRFEVGNDMTLLP